MELDFQCKSVVEMTSRILDSPFQWVPATPVVLPYAKQASPVAEVPDNVAGLLSPADASPFISNQCNYMIVNEFFFINYRINY